MSRIPGTFADAGKFGPRRSDCRDELLRAAMPTLSLLRHAKSSWDHPSLEDHDRPLAGRGRRAATAMGRHMATLELRPDLVLSSTSLRTRETLELFLPALGVSPPVRYEPELYLASPMAMLALAKRETAAPHGEATPGETERDETKEGEPVGHLLLVGHNPGLHALAMQLAGEGRRRDLARLADKLPTAALVVIELDIPSWADLAPGAGRLLHFVTPRDLEAES
jgi:phosphohistidine phosphatase